MKMGLAHNVCSTQPPRDSRLRDVAVVIDVVSLWSEWAIAAEAWIPASRRCCNAPVAACAAPVQYATSVLFSSGDTMGCMLSSAKITQKLMMFDDDKEKKTLWCLYLPFFFFFLNTLVPFKPQLVISRVACVSLHHEQMVKSWASRSEFWGYSHTPDPINNNILKTISGLAEKK